jgi:hypothetical protein
MYFIEGKKFYDHGYSTIKPDSFQNRIILAVLESTPQTAEVTFDTLFTNANGGAGVITIS